MGQHCVAITAVTSNCFGNWLKFRNTAFGKSLHTSGLTDHLIHSHVQRSKELWVKLLWQDLVRSAHLFVLGTDLGILLGIGQNLINHVVEQFKRLWGHLNLFQRRSKRSNFFWSSLRRTRQHFVAKFLWGYGLTHLLIHRHRIRIGKRVCAFLWHLLGGLGCCSHVSSLGKGICSIVLRRCLYAKHLTGCLYTILCVSVNIAQSQIRQIGIGWQSVKI